MPALFRKSTSEPKPPKPPKPPVQKVRAPTPPPVGHWLFAPPPTPKKKKEPSASSNNSDTSSIMSGKSGKSFTNKTAKTGRTSSVFTSSTNSNSQSDSASTAPSSSPSSVVPSPTSSESSCPSCAKANSGCECIQRRANATPSLVIRDNLDPSARHLCKLCYLDLPLYFFSETVPSASCVHDLDTCTNCIREHVFQELALRSTTIVCPSPGCKTKLSEQEIQQVARARKTSLPRTDVVPAARQQLAPITPPLTPPRSSAAGHSSSTAAFASSRQQSAIPPVPKLNPLTIPLSTVAEPPLSPPISPPPAEPLPRAPGVSDRRVRKMTSKSQLLAHEAPLVMTTKPQAPAAVVEEARFVSGVAELHLDSDGDEDHPVEGYGQTQEEADEEGEEQIDAWDSIFDTLNQLAIDHDGVPLESPQQMSAKDLFFSPPPSRADSALMRENRRPSDPTTGRRPSHMFPLPPGRRPSVDPSMLIPSRSTKQPQPQGLVKVLLPAVTVESVDTRDCPLCINKTELTNPDDFEDVTCPRGHTFCWNCLRVTKGLAHYHQGTCERFAAPPTGWY